MVLRFGTLCVNLEDPIFVLTEFNTANFSYDTDANKTWLGPKDPGTEVDGGQALCYYKGLNEDWETGYTRKQSWWNVFAARLGFVLAFQVRFKHINLRFVAACFVYLPPNR